MKTNICKAWPIGDNQVEDSLISIADPLPDTNDLKEAASYYDKEAERLMIALRSLPGGTWDALLRKMLKKRASLLRVPYFDEEE